MGFRAGWAPMDAEVDRAVRPHRDTLRELRRLVYEHDEGLLSTREAMRRIDALAARMLREGE